MSRNNEGNDEWEKGYWRLRDRVKELEADAPDLRRYPYREHWERENRCLKERIKELEAENKDLYYKVACWSSRRSAFWSEESSKMVDKIDDLKDLVDQMVAEELDEERVEQARAAMAPGEESTLRDHQICRLQAQRDRLEQSQADSTNYSQEVIALRQRDRKQVERIKELEEKVFLFEALRDQEESDSLIIYRLARAPERRIL